VEYAGYVWLLTCIIQGKGFFQIYPPLFIRNGFLQKFDLPYSISDHLLLLHLSIKANSWYPNLLCYCCDHDCHFIVDFRIGIACFVHLFKILIIISLQSGSLGSNRPPFSFFDMIPVGTRSCVCGHDIEVIKANLDLDPDWFLDSSLHLQFLRPRCHFPTYPVELPLYAFSILGIVIWSSVDIRWRRALARIFAFFHFSMILYCQDRISAGSTR